MMINLPSYEVVAQLPQTYHAQVPEEWMDVMGHMNVAWYTASFSHAMQTVRSSLGLDNECVATQHIGTFAIETHTRYVAELRFGAHLQIHSRMLNRSTSGKRMHAMHFMVNSETKVIAATFEAIVANVDLTNRRMVPMLPEILERLDKIIAVHQSLTWRAPVCGSLSAQ